MEYKTEQEEFWSGRFGDEYIERNQNYSYFASNNVLTFYLLNNNYKKYSYISIFQPAFILCKTKGMYKA